MTDEELVGAVEHVHDNLPDGIWTLANALDCEAQLLVLEDVFARWCVQNDYEAELPLDASAELIAEALDVSEPPIDAIWELVDFSSRATYGELSEDDEEAGCEYLGELRDWLEELLPEEDAGEDDTPSEPA